MKNQKIAVTILFAFLLTTVTACGDATDIDDSSNLVDRTAFNADGSKNINETDFIIDYPDYSGNHWDSSNEHSIPIIVRHLILEKDKIQECSVTVNQATDSQEVISIREYAVSVVLTTKDGDMLSDAEVQSIAEIIRNVVPDVKNGNIAITDSNLNVYALGGEIVDAND